MKIIFRHPPNLAQASDVPGSLGELIVDEQGRVTLGPVDLRLPVEPGLYYLFKHARIPVSESISVKNYHGSRDAWSALQLNGVEPGSAMLGVFYRGGNDDEMTLFINAPCSYDGDFLVIPENQRTDTALRVLAAYLPAGVVDVGALRAKQWIVKRLSPLDSLAEQEKQLDLISRLVFMLVQRLPKRDRPEWVDALHDAVGFNAAETYGGDEKAIADIGKHKASVRALQQEYFKRRDHNGVDCCAACVPALATPSPAAQPIEATHDAV